MDNQSDASDIKKGKENKGRQWVSIQNEGMDHSEGR